MTGGVYVAIDQGGHATRASAYSADGTLEGAALVTIATQRNALGHVEHDPEEVVASVDDRARRARAHRRAAALAGGRPRGPALEPRLLGRDGRPRAAPVMSWQDTRGAAWLRGLSRRAEDVQRLTGLQLSPHYGASKLRWCLDHLPEVRAAAAQSRLRAGPLASFLLHRLLEERPLLADASTAARTLLWSPFDARLVRGAPRAVRHPARDAAARDRHVACASARSRASGARVPVNVCNGDQSVVPFAAGPSTSTPPTSTSAPGRSCCGRRRKRCTRRRS